MFQKPLSGASLALVFAVSSLHAQEITVSDPIQISSESPDLTLDGAADPSSEAMLSGETAATEATSFFLPGGYGYLPEVITPGSGLYGRPPIELFLNVEMGYDDNIYSSSGKPGTTPKKGSPLTQATMGLNVLFNSPKTFLSLGGDVGAVYYWDRQGDSFSPVGNLNLVFAHRATERLTLSSRITSGYYTQPDVWVQGFPRSNTGDYFVFNGLFDVSYRWTPLFSTVTTAGFSSQLYRESYSDHHNYVSYNLGQQFRFLLNPRFTGVVDLRWDQTFYYNDHDRDTNTEVASIGFDWLMSPRITSTFRGGATFRQYDLPGASDQVAPFGEVAVGYRYGRGSMLQWSARYGFESGDWSYQKTETLRTGLSMSQVITPRLSASLGVYYIYEFRDQLLANMPPVNDQQLLDLSARLNYAINRSFTVYGGYGRTQVFNDNDYSEYTRNRYTLGVTYRF